MPGNRSSMVAGGQTRVPGRVADGVSAPASGAQPPTPIAGGFAAFGLGAAVGLVAGVAMLAWQMALGGLAEEPTALPGIATGVGSMPNSIIAFFFGVENFGSGYRYSTYPGVAVHLGLASFFGALGLLAIWAVAGSRPGRLMALALGVVYGLLLEAVVLNLLVNQVQEVDTVYTATPEWSWWAAHALYGAVLGLLGATWLRRWAPSVAARDERGTGSGI